MADAETANRLHIEQGQTLREQLAVDHPLPQAGNRPESNPLGEFSQRPGHPAHIVGVDMLKPVAQNHPIDTAGIFLRADLAEVPDQFRIEAELFHAVSVWIDLPDQVKIDKAVIDRGDNRIGAADRGAGQRIIPARRVDDDEIGIGPNPRNFLIQPGRRQEGEGDMGRMGQFDARSARGRFPVVEIARQRPLAVIKVNRGYTMTGCGQGDRDVDRRRRFARATLFICKHNKMARTLCHLSPLIPAHGRPKTCLVLIRAEPWLQIIHHLPALRDRLKLLRSDGATIALVPTMGALHEGHLALVEAAKRQADLVVVSIFVNPRQFGPKEDLAAYPRPADADAALLADSGVTLLWMPSVEEMYPSGYATAVSVAGLGDRYCGASRPGHFDGVATVVTKLFTQVRAELALFGEKDWQQLTIIRRMAADLDLGVDVMGVPTVRAADGLALSSRNAYLTQAERKAAAVLPKALMDAATAIERGGGVAECLKAAVASLTKSGFDPIDYVALAGADDLIPMTSLDRPARLLAAARLGKTRLIDNVAVTPRPRQM